MLEAYAIERPLAGVDVKAADFEAVLTFEERQKSRYRCQTTNGKVLGWFVERGQVLADGDLLVCQRGERVRVVAAAEAVSQVESDDRLLLTRAAYHLGNRHVPLQIGAGYLRYQHDHVLDEMVAGLGLVVTFRQAPFNPENGAYHGKSVTGHHHHHHDHDHHHHDQNLHHHDQSQSHDDSHGHSHGQGAR